MVTPIVCSARGPAGHSSIEKHERSATPDGPGAGRRPFSGDDPGHPSSEHHFFIFLSPEIAPRRLREAEAPRGTNNKKEDVMNDKVSTWRMKDEELLPLVGRTIAGDGRAWHALWLALDP